ncbi:flavocytochrome c [Xylariaceae sp. FL1272]|nr:flavocytochrome c [Xylariaceae sp. FL1272]
MHFDTLHRHNSPATLLYCLEYEIRPYNCSMLASYQVGVAIAIFFLASYDVLVSAPFTPHLTTTPQELSTTTKSQMAAKTVVVVGSGLAGLSAAHEALKKGANVHMLERAPKPGGNSMKASSGINGAGTKFQKECGVGSDGSFFDDTVASAGLRLSQAAKEQGKDRRDLIEILTTRSKDAVSWLADEIGVDLSVVAQLGGHSVPRTHRGKGNPPPGAAIVGALLKKLGESPGFTISTSANVDALLTSTNGDGSVRVIGVRYTAEGETRELSGPVVFAAGGFAGDAQGLLAKHRPDLAGFPSTNDARPGSHGLLADIGAEFVDMDSVQIHPTGFVDPKESSATWYILAAEALRGEGGILLSPDGHRFVNEMERRDVVSNAIMQLPRADLESEKEGPKQWHVTLLLDPGACEASASHLGFYLWKGLMQKKKVKDLPPPIIDAVDRYAHSVVMGSDEHFGRKSFGYWKLVAGQENRETEVCIGTVTPVTHFTMGGALFNTKAQVLGRRGDSVAPIDGIWVAGEITGGIHGDNRLGGSSLLECAVFGVIAGDEAAKSLS